MFDLYLNQKDIIDDAEKRCSGGIVVEKFSERFSSSLEYWDADDYKKSWKIAIQLLFDTNFCVFFSDINHPEKTNHFLGYPAFLLDNNVYIQQKMFFHDQYPLDEIQHLNFAKKESLILINDDGNKISTWKCSPESIMQFYKNMKVAG